MADYSLGGSYGGGYGDGGLGLGTGGSSSGLGLGAPSGGYFGGGGGFSGGSGGGLSATADDVFSYNPSFGSGYSPSASYSLGDLYSQDAGTGFNMSGSYGLQMPANPGVDTGMGLGGQEREQDFWNSGMGKFIKGLGRFALATNPAGRLGLMGYDAYNAMQSGEYGKAAGGLVGAATGNGLLGTAVGIGTDAAMGKPVAGRVGGTLGSVVGGQLAGPVGAMAGGYLGSKAGTSSGYTGNPGYSDKTMAGGGGGGKTWDAGQLAAGLGQMYLNNKAAKAAEAQTMNLASLYGPNSAYAQQLKQSLERRDAASGRRSQYGPREVELQAQLAKMMATAGPGIQQQNLAAQQQAQQRRAQTLNSLYAMGRETGLFDKAKDYLGDLFSNSSSQPLYFDSNTAGDVYSV